MTAANILGRIAGWLNAKLGRCVRCMRLSARLAMACLVLAASCAMLSKNDMLIEASWITFLLFAAIWMAHILVYSIRAIRTRSSGGTEVSPDGRLSRRGMLRDFAKIVLLGMAATALPAALMPVNAMAGGCGGQGDCGLTICGSTCCPPPYWFLSLCDCKCYLTQDARVCTQWKACPPGQ
jgi:hypothetical protein